VCLCVCVAASEGINLLDYKTADRLFQKLERNGLVKLLKIRYVCVCTCVCVCVYVRMCACT